MRKPISISIGAYLGDSVILAVCDDGFLWYARSFTDGWKRLPDIPQT